MTHKFSKAQLFVLSVALAAALALPARAGVGDILSLITSITSTIKDGIGTALGGIRSIQNAEKQLQQEVLWPVAVINQAKAEVSRIRSQFGSLAQQIHGLSVNSATLAHPQNLEALLRSEQTGSLGRIGAAYGNVYQPSPGPNSASPATRNLVDADDAFASGALKTAVISDQASERMLSAADAMERQAATAAPGSAPMLSAQALAANLESQAFLQRMLAAELREEAARLAHANALLKESGAATQGLTNGVQRVLGQQ